MLILFWLLLFLGVLFFLVCGVGGGGSCFSSFVNLFVLARDLSICKTLFRVNILFAVVMFLH